jgi:hypothetical protein
VKRRRNGKRCRLCIRRVAGWNQLLCAMHSRGHYSNFLIATGTPYRPGRMKSVGDVPRPHGMRRRYLRWRQEMSHKTALFIPPHVSKMIERAIDRGASIAEVEFIRKNWKDLV